MQVVLSVWRLQMWELLVSCHSPPWPWPQCWRQGPKVLRPCRCASTHHVRWHKAPLSPARRLSPARLEQQHVFYGGLRPCQHTAGVDESTTFVSLSLLRWHRPV